MHLLVIAGSKKWVDLTVKDAEICDQWISFWHCLMMGKENALTTISKGEFHI